MSSILALGYLLQVEIERSEEKRFFWWCLSSGFRWAHSLFTSYSPAPLLMRHRYFAPPCPICSHHSVEVLTGVGGRVGGGVKLVGVLVSLFLTNMGADYSRGLNYPISVSYMFCPLGSFSAFRDVTNLREALRPKLDSLAKKTWQFSCFASVCIARKGHSFYNLFIVIIGGVSAVWRGCKNVFPSLSVVNIVWPFVIIEPIPGCWKFVRVTE